MCIGDFVLGTLEKFLFFFSSTTYRMRTSDREAEKVWQTEIFSFYK